MKYEYRFNIYDMVDGAWMLSSITANRITYQAQTIIGAGEVCSLVARRHHMTTAPSSTISNGGDYARYTWHIDDSKIEIESRRID